MKLLFEIGTEELPPGEIDGALDVLSARIAKGAADARLAIGEIHTYASPRRLAVIVDDVAAAAETVEETMTGPAAKIAFDAEGNPTKAAIGFARGRGVDPADLIRVTTDRGEYVAAVVRKEGETARAVFERVLGEVFAALPWKKAMRWGWETVTFGRPVHWLVAMLDNDVLDVSFADVAAGATTRGHRFLAPDEVAVTPDSYLGTLRAAKVVVDIDERRRVISEAVARLASESGLRAIEDPELVDEVIYLVEWPVPLMGRFPEELLEVPREVLIESMRSHQRYFATETADGSLANGFIFVSNMEVPEPELVVRGNLRVLLARLEDAKFFYREDRKESLEERLPKLASIRYIEGLGSLLDRTERIQSLAANVAERLYPDDAFVEQAALRAAQLCKADLTTGMVYEFPSLQGVMGRYYALLGGEQGDVAKAIFEHYAPRGASDEPPESAPGIVVGLADKLDAIAGCFALGLVPTGSADPYALRRAALGILRTCIDRQMRLPVTDVVRDAVNGLPDPATLGSDKTLRAAEEVCADVEEFIAGRLRAMLAASFPTDIADAVVAVIGADLPSAPVRAAVLDRMRREADFEPLAVAFKRTVNILKKAAEEDPALGAALADAAPDPQYFDADAERALSEALAEATPIVGAAISAGDFDRVAATLIGLKPAIDRFFDDVMVNVESDAVRFNRLTLLAAVRALFESFADISRIQVDGR